MTGAATLGDDGSFRLSVTIGGKTLRYVRDADGSVTRERHVPGPARDLSSPVGRTGRPTGPRVRTAPG